MKSIFFFARDPGGTNALIPVIMAVRCDFRTVVYGKDEAVGRFRRNGIGCEDIVKSQTVVSVSGMEALLRLIMPDMVITGTSSDDFTEKYLWAAAVKLGIPSFAVLDSWVNYGIRFSKYVLKDIGRFQSDHDLSYLPYRILVMDEYARDEMIREGIPSDRICVTGQPHLQFMQRRFMQVHEADVRDYRERAGCRGKTALIVYASDNISQSFGDDNEAVPYWGYNEKTIFPHVYSVLKETCPGNEKPVLVIRPHPKEDAEYWKEAARNNRWTRIIVDSETPGELIIRSADLIVSMQSMFLLESALADKEIMSVQIGLKRKDPLILSRLGIIEPILDDGQLKSRMQDFFCGKNRKKPIWRVGENAVENIVCLIKETLWQN